MNAAQRAVHTKIVESDRRRREARRAKITAQMEVFDLFLGHESRRLLVDIAAARQLVGAE